MTLQRLRALVGAVVAHPVAFLLAINIVCAVLGLAQFAFTLTILKPTDFAVIGVLAAIGGVVTGLFDVKLADLTSRHFFATAKADTAARASLLATSFVLHIAAGLGTGALIMGVSWALAPHFLDQSLVPWWIAAIALRMAMAYPANALTSFQRMLGAFRSSGWLRLAAQTLSTMIMIAALSLQPGLDGYFIGMAISATASTALGLLTTDRESRVLLGRSLLAVPSRRGLAPFLGSGRFLAGGSLLGWSKQLGRSGDVLIVAAFSSDAIAGLYRVARQASDNLAGLSDAVHQFYTPTIVDAASKNRSSEVARHKLRLMGIGLMVAAGAIAASWIVLRPLTAAHNAHYLPALPAFEILASLSVVSLGVHGWLWPLLIARGGVARFGVWGLIGASAQLATMAGLGLTGLLDATTAALTGWVMAVIAYGPLLSRLRIEAPKG